MRFISWLQTTIEEEPGIISSMRLMMVLAIVAVVATWVFVSIWQKAMQPIPDGVGALVGMLTAGKVVQRFGEK